MSDFEKLLRETGHGHIADEVLRHNFLFIPCNGDKTIGVDEYLAAVSYNFRLRTTTEQPAVNDPKGELS
jgi:hypothetical protein